MCVIKRTSFSFFTKAWDLQDTWHPALVSWSELLPSGQRPRQKLIWQFSVWGTLQRNRFGLSQFSRQAFLVVTFPPREKDVSDVGTVPSDFVKGENPEPHCEWSCRGAPKESEVHQTLPGLGILIRGQWGIGTGCPKHGPHPSRPGWMGPCSGGKCLFPWQGAGTGWSIRPL